MDEIKPGIHLHIERLILEGLSIDKTQAPFVRAAVEAELTRLLARDGLATSLQAGSVVPEIRADTIKLAPGGNPAQVGKQIAQSVYGGIGKGR